MGMSFRSVVRSLDLSFKVDDYFMLHNEGKGDSKHNTVRGWFMDVSDTYNGEGCLVYFRIIHLENDRSYCYALSDEDVKYFSFSICCKIIKPEENFDSLMGMYFSPKIEKKLKACEKKTKGWYMGVFVKDHYGEWVDHSTYDYSHLHTSEGLTYENLIKDIDEIRMRGISYSQFLAEQCMQILDKEK